MNIYPNISVTLYGIILLFAATAEPLINFMSVMIKIRGFFVGFVEISLISWEKNKFMNIIRTKAK